MALCLIVLIGMTIISVQLAEGLSEIWRVRRWQRFVLSQIALAVCAITGCVNSPHFDIGDNEYVCGPHL